MIERTADQQEARVKYRRSYYSRFVALLKGEPKGRRANSCIHQIAIRTQGDVAKILGISRQAVHQTERRAFKKIREAMEGYRNEA